MSTMKRILLLLICFVFASFSQNKNNVDYNFVGEWQDAKNAANGSFTFEKDGTASIKVGGQVLGGPNYLVDGKKGTINYVIDTTTKPIHIDLIMSLEGHNETKKLLMNVEIIDANTIKLGTNFDDTRPESFTEDNSMLLKRAQK